MNNLSANEMKVTIFNKEYCVSCPEGQQQRLTEAADYLNRRTQEMKDSGAGLAAEKSIVITALNLAHELLEQRRGQQHQQSGDDKVRGRLETIKERLDANMFQRRMRTGQLHQF